jgi:hypothetical protein
VISPRLQDCDVDTRVDGSRCRLTLKYSVSATPGFPILSRISVSASSNQGERNGDLGFADKQGQIVSSVKRLRDLTGIL